MNKAIFIDKDGTLVEDIPYNVNPDHIRLQPLAIEGLKKLQEQGYLLIVVSNQSGIARGYFHEDAMAIVRKKLNDMLMKESIQLNGYFFCPHHPEGTILKYAIECNCRKPKPGMILKAAEEFNVRLSDSWMVGDILHDVEAGNKAGCKTVLIDNGNETEWIFTEWRKPTVVVKNINDAAAFIIKNDGL
jgi:D-glycero-D-manno-heptose 1,7-bisphosphate phosphatase